MKNKQLLILRHAKSDWDAHFHDDFDRPLSKRGRHDAQRVGHWMRKQQVQPGVVMCSPAVRARETWEHVANCIDVNVNMAEFPRSLYLADLDDLLTTIRSIPDNYQSALLVGHNPGLEELVDYLAVTPPPVTDSGKLFTTANLALFELPGGFANIESHHNRLVRLLRPAELKE